MPIAEGKATMYDYRILDLSMNGINQMIDLLNSVFVKRHSKIRTFGLLDWQYNGNPIGKAVGFNPYYHDELVAHYATKCQA